MAKKNRAEVIIEVDAKIQPTVTTTIHRSLLNEDIVNSAVFEKDVITSVTPAGSNEVIDYADRDTATITIAVNTSFSFTSLENGAVKFLVITKGATNTISFAGATDSSARKTYINTTPTLVVYRVSNKNGAIYVESINIDNDVSSGKSESFFLEIGVFDMDATITKSVAYALPAGKKMININTSIYNDAEDRIYKIEYAEEIADPQISGHVTYNSATGFFSIYRVNGRFFDSASFNDGVINRGHITFDLIDA